MALYYTLATLLQTANAWIQVNNRFFYLNLQWIWLNSLLQSPHYAFWGPSLVTDLMNGDDWQKTGHFPRVTHCDFSRRRPASVQLDTVLCVLGLNIYYEKLFIFLWFWFLFVAWISAYNSFKWLYRLFVRSSARANIDSYLTSKPREFPVTKDTKEHFYSVLGPDGLFILQQLSLNLGDMPTS